MKKKGKIGAFDLFSLGFGAIIGVGWSVTLNNLIMMGGGPIPTMLGFLLAMVLIIPITFCFAELSTMFPVAGGVVAYAYKAYGHTLSFLGGWFVAFAYISILPWEAIAINDIIGYIFPVLKSGDPLYIVAGEGIYPLSLLVGISLSFIIIGINVIGVDFAAKVQTGLIIILIACSSISVIFLLLNFSFDNLEPIYQEMPGKNHTTLMAGILTVCASGPFYFAGFDTIPQSIEDIGKGINKKLFGKIIMSAVIFAGIFYSLIFVSAGASYPWGEFVGFERPALSSLLRHLYPGFLGHALFYISLAGTLAGLFTTWNGFFIAGSRMLMGMARIGYLPRFFAKQHEKTKAPIGGNILCAVFMLAGPFLGIGVIDPLTLLGSAGFIIGWLLVCISALRLRKKHPELNRPYLVPGGRSLIIVAIATSTFMAINCIVPGMPGYISDIGLIILVAWLVIGAVMFISTAKKRNSVSKQEVEQRIFGDFLK